MDKWWNLILESTKAVNASSDERKQAIIRAGLIAQAYNVLDKETLESVFGPFSTLVDSGSLNDDKKPDSIGS